jgi:putative ABC transport system substrate-binding protein
MRRREFISLLGGAAAAWPTSSRGQQAGPIRQIACLLPFAENDPLAPPRVAAFERALYQLGWRGGRNIRIDYRWAASNPELARTYARELAARNPDVILTGGAFLVATLARETQQIPIVFAGGGSTVEMGQAESVARPNRNVTGFPAFEPSMGGKWLSLLMDIAPSITRVAIIFNPKTAPYTQGYLPVIEAAARSLSVSVTATPVLDPGELERAVGAFGRDPGGGLVVMPDIFTVEHRSMMISLAARNRLPTFYTFRLFVTDGGLLYYGTEIVELYRRAASYVDRILQGASPGDLPIQYPTKFELVINLRTAKALGLAVSPELLAHADEVIEQ